jgi:hypothetical protein
VSSLAEPILRVCSARINEETTESGFRETSRPSDKVEELSRSCKRMI